MVWFILGPHSKSTEDTQPNSSKKDQNQICIKRCHVFSLRILTTQVHFVCKWKYGHVYVETIRKMSKIQQGFIYFFF